MELPIGFSRPYKGGVPIERPGASLPINQAIFMAIVENAADGIILLDQEGKIKYVSPSSTDLGGHPVDEVLGVDNLTYAHPEDQEMLKARLLEVLRQPGASVSVEYRLRHKQGHYFWVEAKAFNLLEDPDVSGIIAFMRDVNGRKLAEQALRESEYEARETAAQLWMVNQIGLKINAGLDFEQLLQTVYEQCRQIGDTDMFYIALYDEASSTVSFPLIYRDMERRAIPPLDLGVNPGYVGYIIENRQTLYIPKRIDLPAGVKVNVSLLHGRIINSSVGVPMMAEGRVVGVLSMQSVNPEAYTPKQIQTMELLATQVAIAIQNSRLYQQSQQELAERRRAEEALRESERRLSSALESTRTGLYEEYLQTGGTYFSPTWFTMLGYEPDEFPPTNDTWMDLLHPEDRAPAQRRIVDFLANRQKELLLEFRMRAKDGEYRWIEDRGFAVAWDEAGSITRVIGTHADITERKKAEEQQMMLVTMLEEAPAGIVVHDEHGRIFYANENACKIHGYAAGEFAGLNLRDLLAVEERLLFEERLQRIQAAEAMSAFEAKHQRKDGTILRVGVQVRSVRWLDRPAFLSVQTDLTERKRIEEERSRLNVLVEQAVEAIVLLDLEGNIQYVNPAFTEITGYSLAEVQGKSPRFLDAGLPEQDDRFYGQIWRTITAGNVWRGRFVNRRKEGRLITQEAAISPVRDETNNIVSYVVVERDITKELDIEAQLLQSQKLESIGTLASGIAHEINNPINAIMNLAQLIEDDLPAGNEATEFLEQIKCETDRVSTIVRNLLSFARHDSQAHSLARISDIVDATMSLINTVLRHDQIEVIVDVPDDLPPFKCRSQQIQQVLMNLVTNARDALNTRFPKYDERKQILIKAHLFKKGRRQWIRTMVEDHGCGIPAEIRSRIFDPFYTTKPRDSGTGLGLSISHGIIASHQGALSFDSAEKSGTRFYMDLPLDNGWRLSLDRELEEDGTNSRS